ncbi:MAG: DeoR/GlpR family DNA-binding transcription regulator [Thermaerobacter sp.]|nr:DeoR/GlpR family DNA-binding transcription regulator [Thermaerobacter sp.]
MLTKRRKELLELLQSEPEMSINDLVDRLGVSAATVRRDLNNLSSQGLIQRLRGGATISHNPLGIEPSWLERHRENIDKKRAIVRLALDAVEDGQVVALDVGTTTLELARLLQMRSDLMVFTASVPISEMLARGRPTVYLVGGRVRPREMGVVGPLARDIIGRFHYDVFFLAAAGWSLEQGLMDFSIEDVEIKQAFMNCSNQVIALVDSTKYGKTSLMSIAPLKEVDMVITDDQLPTAVRDQVSEVTTLRWAEVENGERGLG